MEKHLTGKMESSRLLQKDTVFDELSRMKVLHLIASPKIGGAEKLLLTILDHIDTNKYNIAIAVFIDAREKTNLFYDELKKSDIEIFPIVISGAYDLRQILQIYRILTVFKPDLIHSHGYKTNILGYLVSRKLKVSIVSTVHGWLHSNKLTTRLFNQVNLHVLKRFDRVIAVSGQIESVLLDLQIPVSRLITLRNVPNIKKELKLNKTAAVQRFSLSPQAKYVGFIGRLEPVKGGDIFIAAAIKVLAVCPDIQFVIAGEGSEMHRLEAEVAHAGFTDRIRFLGFHNSPEEVLCFLDLYVLPSRDEGIPLSLLEAMSAEVPVVASSVGGIPEVIQNGVNGILVPPGNPQLLADTICNSLKDTVSATRRKKAARKTIDEEFNIESWIENLQTLYVDLQTR